MEENTVYQAQIEIARLAGAALAAVGRETPGKYDKFVKWFHLRPGSGNITIVTTHHSRPMRGIHVGKTEIKSSIDFLADCIADDGKTVDWEKIARSYNAGRGFDPGDGNGKKEYPYQAEMINHLAENQKLKGLLGVQNLYFTGSEILFSRGDEKRKKIDIVAHDGRGKVFFFEMKAPGNKRDDAVTQVKSYLDMYGKGGEKNGIFEKMMAVYPQNPIDVISEYVGCGIVGYSENPILEKENLFKCLL